MLLAGRVETVGWLIQHQQPGLGEQGGGQPEPLTPCRGRNREPVVGTIVSRPGRARRQSLLSAHRRRGARTARQRGEVLPRGK